MLTFAPSLQYHSMPLNIIQSFKGSHWGCIKKPHSVLAGVKGLMRQDGNGFSIKFQHDVFSQQRGKLDVGQSYKKVEFSNKNHQIILEDFFLEKHSPPTFRASVSFFYSKEFSKTKEYYYRLIVPLTEEIKFHYCIEECGFATDLGYRSRLGTKATIDGDTLHVSILDKDEQYYLAIESQQIQNYKTFSEKAFAVKNALGFMTGHLAGNKGWFFAYSKKEMKEVKHYYYCELRKSIMSSYMPLNSNPYAYLHHRRKAADKLYKAKKLRVLPIAQFSLLCQKLHDSVDFASAIVLFLESSVASLLFMPGGYSIVLESLSDIIMGEVKDKIAPIQPKPFAGKVRKSLTDTINTYSTVMPGNDWETIKKRIDNINQPTNKARLQAPFKRLGITLLPLDIDILETRNDFLHGRFPDITKAGDERPLERKNKDLYYAAIRLYTLIGLVVLKWIGFDGYIINHPKIQQDFTKIRLKEGYYRIV